MSSEDVSHTRSFRVPKYIRSHFFASIAINCVLTFFVTAVFFRMQPKIPIFYSLAESNDYLADKYWIFVFPAFSVTVTILHLLLLPGLRNHDKMILQLFAWMTVLVQCVCVVAALRIILIIW